ncbi:MAG: crotonase/enoyl-CoA hydratase family protein [Chloroflexota bacterium]
MSDVIDIQRDGAVTIITIIRPERRNAINGETANALREAWLAFDADDTQRVGILTGGNKVFCAGADLKEIDTLDITNEAGALGFTHLQVSKPTIAAIAGYAVAGGLELACWCDLRIVDETATFGCLERRFGVPLVDGGTVRLPQIVGLGRALELILTGRLISADEAYEIGLANEITAPKKALKRAVKLAKQLAEFPQVAMLNDRRSVYESLGKSLPDALANEARLGAQTWASGEGKAGAQAFTDGAGRNADFEIDSD